MALTLVSHGTKVVALGYDTTTGERGFLVKFINRTGGDSVEGDVVAASPSTDKEAIKQFNELDAFGVVAEDGIAEGSEMWVWMNGSVAQVLLKDTVASTRGQIALCADTDGRIYTIAVPDVNPVVAEHFKEIGHCMESKMAGTNVLALVCLHFN